MTGSGNPTRLLYLIPRNILAMKMIVSMIAGSPMTGRPLLNGNSRPSPNRRRPFGIQDTSGNERQSFMRTKLLVATVSCTALSIVALMSGCSSAGGSVMSFHFGLPLIGAEIDFALYAPVVNQPSSPATSQPSLKNAAVECE